MCGSNFFEACLLGLEKNSLHGFWWDSNSLASKIRSSLCILATNNNNNNLSWRVYLLLASVMSFFSSIEFELHLFVPPSSRHFPLAMSITKFNDVVRCRVLEPPLLNLSKKMHRVSFSTSSSSFSFSSLFSPPSIHHDMRRNASGYKAELHSFFRRLDPYSLEYDLASSH